MNIYTAAFACNCPSNGVRNNYTLRIENVQLADDYAVVCNALGHASGGDIAALMKMKSDRREALRAHLSELRTHPAAQPVTPSIPQLTYEEAREIAFRAAKAFRPSYFTGNDFEPHQWVVHAIISATNPGQLAAAKGRDYFSRMPAIASPPPSPKTGEGSAIEGGNGRAKPGEMTMTRSTAPTRNGYVLALNPPMPNDEEIMNLWNECIDDQGSNIVRFACLLISKDREAISKAFDEQTVSTARGCRPEEDGSHAGATPNASVGPAAGNLPDRIDAYADECEPGSQRQSDLYAAATLLRKSKGLAK